MGDKVKPPKLPARAPRELKDFLACKIMEVDLDPANAGWIPKPDYVPDGLAPEITPTATGTNAVSVAVGWGFVSLTLPVTLSGGQLQVDATNLPGKEGIDTWVRNFNDALRSNGKELSGLEIRNGKIHLTKRVIGATDTQQAVPATPATPVTPTPATTPTPPATAPTATPQATSTEGDGQGIKPGCLIGIILALVLFLGAGIVYMIGRGDDEKTVPTYEETIPIGEPSTSNPPLDEKLICARLEILEQVLEDFGVSDPCEIPPEDFWEACENYMPCMKLNVPLVVLSDIVGISHDGSVPDANTGQTGPSGAKHKTALVGPVYDPNAWLEAISRCGNNTITGRSMISPSGVTSIDHPLFNYGQCRAELFYQAADFRQTLGSYDYSVSDAAIAAGDPVTDGISVPTETSLNAAGTTLGLLGGKALDPGCTWYSANSALLSLESCLKDRWVFNAAWNDPRIVSYGAGYINPLGIAGPTEEQMAPFGPSRLFGPGTLYPCGPGHFGYTACTAGEPAVESSAFVGGTVSFAQRLDEVPVGTYVGVAVDEYWVKLSHESDSWTLTTSEEGATPQSRAILRGNSITFIMPFDEAATPDLTYTLSVGDANSSIDQPPQPVLGVVTSTQGPETPADFFRQMSNSIATGDLTYALERLHPLVYEAFPGDVCRTELSLRVTPDYNIALQSVGEVAPWTWELPDGRSYEVPEATTVSIILPGNTDPVDAHLVNIDRMYYWFTICDAR